MSVPDLNLRFTTKSLAAALTPETLIGTDCQFKATSRVVTEIGRRVSALDRRLAVGGLGRPTGGASQSREESDVWPRGVVIGVGGGV